MNGAPGGDMEAVLGSLGAEDDIKNKLMEGAKGHVPEDDGVP